MRSLIIHLPGTTARAKNVARLLQDLPNAQVVDAVDGRDPQQAAEVKSVSGTLHQPIYPFELNEGEIGCFLSHRRCWQIIAQGDAPYVLIAEDDLHISPKPFAAAIALVEQHANEQSFIRLPAKTRERATNTIAHQDGAMLFLPKTIGLQSVCQVVGRAAAKRLLDMSTTIDRPVDTTLQMHWATGQQVHTIMPSGISEIPAPSTIQRKTRTSDLLMRGIRRANYRAQIRRRPQTA